MTNEEKLQMLAKAEVAVLEVGHTLTEWRWALTFGEDEPMSNWERELFHVFHG